MNDISTQKVRELLERIHELESQLNLSELARLGLLESLEQFRQALDWGEESRVLGFELIQELEQERNAALERVRELEPILEAALIMDTKTQNHWATLESGDPELLKPEARSQSYAQMITAEKKVFDLIKPFRKLEAKNA